MIVTQELVEEYGLPASLVGAKAHINYERKGGSVVCPDCGLNLGEASVYNDGITSHVTSDGPKCPIHGKSRLKGAQKTGNMVVLIEKDCTMIADAEARLRPGDKFDAKLGRKICFGRIAKHFKTTGLSE